MSSIGTIWLGSATRPSVAMTALNPSSSGMPAATRAPNATMRMISVIGSDSFSAFLKSSENDFDRAFSALASPNSPTKTPLFCAFTRSTAATTGSIASAVWSVSPRTLKVTRTERPSLAIWFSLPLA